MTPQKTIKRLVACFGSIQLLTALSVLSCREQEQQGLNYQYENYLVITPLFTPEGQNEEFASFIENMAKSIGIWQKIVYVPLEQVNLIAKKLKYLGLPGVSNSVREQLGIQHPDEIYLARGWGLENRILMNIYESAEKICYGDGIGIYFSPSVFHAAQKSADRSPIGKSLVSKVQKFFRQSALPEKDFDIGYFSLPSAFGEVPPMKTVIVNKGIYLQSFQNLKRKLSDLIDLNYINDIRQKIQNTSTSILLTSNFSEAAGRMSLESEIAAYREFLESQGIPQKSILLIKPHPRDSKHKILQLKSALSDLYSDILILAEDFLFYLPFEVFFMEVFLSPNLPKLLSPKIFTFSSACLTLRFLFNAECIVGFGSNIVNNFFEEKYALSRIKHEADLLSTIGNIRELSPV
jgi:hypothetical protein